MNPGLPITAGCWRPGWLLLALWLAAAPAARADGRPMGEGEPFAQHFSPRDYHGGTQCLCTTQDARGVVYVGSLGVILEYDGSAWRKLTINSDFVSALAYDPATDTIFVGAANDLGYLKPLPGDGRAFVSLLAQLPPEDREVGGVYGVHVTPDGVFFVGTSQVMRWRDGRFKTWKLTSAAKLRSDWTGGRLYVYSDDVGLLRLEGDALAAVSDDPRLRQAAPRAVLAPGDGSLLLGTLHEGLLTLRDGTVRPADGECGVFLKEKGVFKMRRLHDGSLAMATDTAGLVVVGPDGRFRSHCDGTGGVHGTNIFDLFEDAEGGLWVGLQSGVTRVEVNSPLSFLRAGPDDDLSSAYCYGYWFGTMVLGTHAGWYRVVPADPAAAVGAHLERVPGSGPFASTGCAVDNGLLTITNSRVVLLDADARWVPVDGGTARPQSLCASRVHPGVVYLLDTGGRLSVLRLDAETRRWTDAGTVAELGEVGVQVDVTESASGDLWVDTGARGLFRVRLTPGGQAAVTSFLDQPGLLKGIRSVQNCGVRNPLRFKTAHLLCGLDPSGQEPRPLTEFGPRFCDGSLNFGDAISYDAGSLWFTATDADNPTGEALRGRAVAGGGGRAPAFQPLPHKVEEAIGSVGIFDPVEVPPAPLRTILLAGTTGNGVVRLDVAQWEAQQAPRAFATLIRRALTRSGATPKAVPAPISADPLPSERNSVHFEFAAATMAFGAAPRFQTRLVNFGAGDWSDWSDRNGVDYLNLPGGRYVFEVRARDSDGRMGSLASLGFRVLPPWWRAPWAYAAYGLALALAFWGLFYWRGRWLRRRNTALAAVVEDRTAELRQREAELVRARDAADAANRAKSVFLANMSHELRTPLNAVLGYTQLLLKQTDLSARSRERVAVIGQSGGHLLALVNEVLDLAKVEAGKLALSRTEFLLSPLLDEVAAVFRPRFAEKGLRFTDTRAPDLPAVVGTDGRRLRQVLFNLLSNAVKFTHHGGVGLGVRPAGEGQVRFEVSDTGVGIEPGDLPEIFQAFHQAGGQRLSAQGTGLGLAISQRLVELLGGRIEVESTPGRGSRFWFDLPLAAGELTREPDGHAPPADAEPGPVTSYEGAPQRLLLVDDVRETRRVLRGFLQPLGFEIEEAADGAECLAVCARTRPDAVLLDLRLGRPDGFEVARTLRARTDGARLGIIAISASVFDSDRQRALDAGCDDFLSKPVDMVQLLGTLSGVLGIRWTRETPSAPGSPADLPAPGEEGRLTPPETDALLELSLRGDVAGIRKHLEALRAADGPASRAALVRRLESLAAAYDMEGIHELLLAARAQPAD